MIRGNAARGNPAPFTRHLRDDDPALRMPKFVPGKCAKNVGLLVRQQQHSLYKKARILNAIIPFYKHPYIGTLHLIANHQKQTVYCDFHNIYFFSDFFFSFLSVIQ